MFKSTATSLILRGVLAVAVGIALEYLEPSGGLREALDDPEPCGGVEQPGPQHPGFPLVAPDVVAAVGQDDVDAGQRAVPARPGLGSDQGVGGAEYWLDKLGTRVGEQEGRVAGRVLGVGPGSRGVGGDDVVDRRVARAASPGVRVRVLEAKGVGKIARDDERRGVG